MVYGIIELINFAHGDMFMIGAFVAVVFLGADPGLSTGAVDDTSACWSSCLIVGALAVRDADHRAPRLTIERFVYRPLRNAPRLAPLITAIGVSFILQNVVLVVAGSGDRRAPQIFPRTGDLESWARSIPVLSTLHLRRSR